MVTHDRRLDWLQKHVNDLIALETHVLDTVRRQRESDELAAVPDAATLSLSIERVLQEHVVLLENYLEHIGGHGGGAFKKAVTHLTGTVAGIYGRMREHPASRFLRDSYTALNHAAVAYEMLHTTALAHREVRLAQLAIAHLRDLTPLIMGISRQVPYVVAQEVADSEGGDPTIAQEAEGNVQRCWRQEPALR